MNEEQFEKWFNTANIPLHQHYSAKRTWQAAFAAGREEGLREALKCALVNQLRAALPAEFTILSGDDPLTLPYLSVGAEGVISVASNIIPKEMVRMVQSFNEGRFAEAREIHIRFYPLFRDLFIEANPIPIKTALSLAGRISGEFRLPLCEMAPANEAKLLATLRSLNLVK